MRRSLLLSSAAIAAIPSFVYAAESVTYSYDELGRLVETRVSGGPRGGVTNVTSFDPAGNRVTYVVSGVGGVSAPPPAPPPPAPPPSPPPPPPPNQPPVSVADPMLSVACNARGDSNVLGNDTDPENDLPLSMTLTGGSGLSYVVKSGTQSIRFNAPPTPKTDYTVTYVITDARGAATSASLSLRVTGSTSQCGGPVPLSSTTGSGG
jgi:Bacterial Ig domain